MIMKKMMVHLTAAVFLMLWLAGCGTGGEVSAEPDGGAVDSGILYTNLWDTASREEVVSALQDHGVSQSQSNTFLGWVDDFNARVTEPKLPDGFTAMQGDFVDYSGLRFNHREREDGSWAPEANCRLSAFLLLREKVGTNGTIDDSDTYLMFDIEAARSQTMYQMKETDLTNFTALYNWIPVEAEDTLEMHIQKIEEAWRAREITIEDAQGISLVSVYLHSTFDNVRFPGHTGVLIETGDGLLFVEKYGPEAPFQATKFHNREELRRYLLARPDLYGDEQELPPVIMENGAVME